MNSLVNFSQILNHLNRVAIGFEPVMHDLEARSISKSSTYPPYNIVKVGESDFRIELAVAGFSQNEIQVEQHRNLLKISGNKEQVDTNEYMHKGISSRSFNLEWKLAEYVRVLGANIQDGILVITLSVVIPDEDKPKLIAIGSSFS